MRTTAAVIGTVVPIIAIVTLPLTACNRDVKKYAQVICEEMQDPEISCTNGRRRTDTLSPNLVLVQYNACRQQKIFEAIGRGGLTAVGDIDFDDECETTADKYGLTETKFFTLDQKMVARCQHGEEEACLITCCGKDRHFQAMPMLPDYVRGPIQEMNP